MRIEAMPSMVPVFTRISISGFPILECAVADSASRRSTADPSFHLERLAPVDDPEARRGWIESSPRFRSLMGYDRSENRCALFRIMP
jgi:hypothetical protein